MDILFFHPPCLVVGSIMTSGHVTGFQEHLHELGRPAGVRVRGPGGLFTRVISKRIGWTFIGHPTFGHPFSFSWSWIYPFFLRVFQTPVFPNACVFQPPQKKWIDPTSWKNGSTVVNLSWGAWPLRPARESQPARDQAKRRTFIFFWSTFWLLISTIHPLAPKAVVKWVSCEPPPESLWFNSQLRDLKHAFFLENGTGQKTGPVGNRLLPMLNFIASSIWTRLFGHSAELLKGGENTLADHETVHPHEFASEVFRCFLAASKQRQKTQTHTLFPQTVCHTEGFLR